MDQKCVYILSQCACAVIECMGMVAENKLRESQGLSPAYDEVTFVKLIEDYGIHNNAVLEYLGDA